MSLTVVVHRTPAAQLPFQIVDSKKDVTALCRSELQDVWHRNIDVPDFDKPRHWRTFKKLDEPERGLGLGSFDATTGAQVGARNSE